MFACVMQVASPVAADISGPDSKNIEPIVQCVVAGREVVLLAQNVECKDPGKGAQFLEETNPGMPLDTDADKACSQDEPNDQRKLSGDAIKRIVSLIKPSDVPRGIRIIGAVFCEQQLDLIGLDLPYSLVIDRSLFAKGLEARNFRTKGDFSFDGSLALERVLITRAHIDGSIYGQDAYFKQLRVLDSQVLGSMIFRRSKISEPVIVDTVKLSGELSVREAALSYLLLQFSTVGGIFDLTDSQARCAYVIRKSDIGDLVAVEAGFGAATTIREGEWAADTGKKQTFYYWLPPNSPSASTAFNITPHSSVSARNRLCSYWPIALPGNFIVSDTRVHASLCFRSFHWLASTEPSYVAINDLNVDATSFIDFGPSNGHPIGPDAQIDEWRKIEIIGLKTYSLIFNFSAADQVNEMSVGGLAFEQVYTAPAVKCAYDPDYYRSRPNEPEEFLLGNVGDLRSQYMRLPRVNEIMSWLNQNCLRTTQPLSAFVDVAKKAGDITEATQLQIARETKELSLRIQRLLGPLGIKNSTSCGTEETAMSSLGEPVNFINYVGNFINYISDWAAVLFGSFLWLVADHGYRPQKVGWFVGGTLVCAAAYFWLRLRVVGFMSANKTTIHPVGIAFLFDRLLPAYRISEEHYDIESYYKLASKAQKRKDSCRYLEFLRFKIRVVKAEQKDTRRIEKSLVILKSIGFILAIFLVAAIQALVVH
jgi:hypothetical protein